MRIASSTLFEAGVARLTEGQASLARLQNQISSGQKLLTPSDDPVASARVVELTQQQAQNAQFASNRQTMAGVMAQTEVTLSSVTSLLQTAQTLTLTAGNSTLNEGDRKAMAVTVNAQLEQLVGLANTRDAAGNAIFAGFQSKGDAFKQTGSGASYQGDQGQVMVQVDSARQMSANIPGDQLFQGGGADLFSALTSLRDLHRPRTKKV
jgi:flagellar hook-associated protein 3 FlgL